MNHFLGMDLLVAVAIAIVHLTFALERSLRDPRSAIKMNHFLGMDLLVAVAIAIAVIIMAPYEATAGAGGASSQIGALGKK
ncbi:hypothetical protein MRX96_030186 [Rhipicephalus microplus]